MYVSTLGSYASEGTRQRMPRETFLKKYTATGADGGKTAGKESESYCMITDIIGINVFFFFFFFFGIVRYRMAGCKDRLFRGSHANT